MENKRKRASSEKAGFIQHLSPKKLSYNGNPYYLLQMQISKSESERLVCYSLQKVTQMKKFVESKSPVKLENLKQWEDGTPVINDNTIIQGIKPFDITFDYEEHENITAPPSAESTQVTVKDLSQYDVFGNNFFTLKGYIHFGPGELKEVETKRGKSCIKEDVIFIDDSGEIEFHVWESVLNQLTDHSSFIITHVMLKKFKKVYITSTTKTVVTPVSLEYEIPTLVNSDFIKHGITQFKSVQGTEIYKLCCTCRRQIDIIGEKKLMKCSYCGTRAHVSDLDMSAKCKVNYLTDGEECSAIIIKDVIQVILCWSGKDISSCTEDDIEEAILEIDCDLELTIKNGVIVGIIRKNSDEV